MKLCGGKIVWEIDAMVTTLSQQEGFLQHLKLLIFQRIQYGAVFYLVLQVKNFWIEAGVRCFGKLISNHV